MDFSSLFEGTNVSSNFFSDDKTLNVDNLIQYIKSILNNVFDVNPKKEIHTYSNRLNFACPYCGDSSKDVYAKRGNLFFKNLKYKCFNCGAYVSVYELLVNFNMFCNVSQDDICLYRTHYNLKIERPESNIDIFDEEKIKKYAFKRSDFKDMFGLIEVKGTKAEKFLNKRYQEITPLYLYEQRKELLYILNMTKDEFIIGTQIRKIKEKKYFTYKLSTLYKELKRTINETEKKDIESIDLISSIFNILRLDYNQPITIFEGPFDSFLFKNSIALSGINTAMPIDGENFRYWFDNDEIGRSKSIEKMKNKKKVFLWKKYLKKIKIPYDTIKDLNELIIYSKEKSVRLVPFIDYFSDSRFDMLNI